MFKRRRSVDDDVVCVAVNLLSVQHGTLKQTQTVMKSPFNGGPTVPETSKVLHT